MSGIDVMAVADALVTDVWSLTGSRRFGTDDGQGRIAG
ncbi:hypothetical protein M2266_005853 [Streptomyces sp. SPB162]|nr:hypothetical protein [Streptomyces sp. SPB162]